MPPDNMRPHSGFGWAVHALEADLAALPGELISRNAYAPLASNSVVEVLSSSSADTTQKVTIVGINSDGQLIEETVSLNGTTVVTTSATFHSVDFAYLNLKAAGTVTIQHSDDTDVGTITIGEMRMDIVHHIVDARRRGFITDFIAGTSTATEILEFQLRYYPNIVDIRGTTAGFFILDRIQIPAAVADVHHRFATPLAAPFLGGYFAVLGGGAAGTGDGNVTLIGYDA